MIADINESKMKTQINFENMYAKNHTIPRIKEYFISCNIHIFLDSVDIPREFGINLMVQMALHKRASIPVLVGLLMRHTDADLQKAADYIEKALQANLISWNETEENCIVNFPIPDSLQTELDIFQYPIPCVVKPKKLQNNRDTGYYTMRNSAILKNNHHDDDINLDHLNMLNSIKLSLNTEVVRLVQNKWKNIDKRKDGETVKEFRKRQRAFSKFDRTSRDVIESLVIQDNEFYLTHKYDKRGRCYSMGYHVNYQGNDWCKAVIQFKNEEIVDG